MLVFFPANPRLSAALAAAGLLGLGILPARQAPAKPTPNDLVTPPAGHVDVGVGGFVIDVVKISGAEQNFTADVALLAQWEDTRLTKRGAGIHKLDEIWHPEVSIANIRNAKTMLPDVVEVYENGLVVYRQRIVGDFSAHFNLHQFPKDIQTLPIQFVARGNSAKIVDLLPLPNLTGRAKQFTLSDWDIEEVKFRRNTYPLPGLGIELPGIVLEFQAKRLVGYYLGTIVVTSGIILCMAALVFWLGLEAINPRISVTVTSMLTLVAHRFVVQSQLPHLSYFTKMDYFLLGATLLVLLGLAGVVAVNTLSKTDRDRAARINRRLRWLHPLGFAVLLVVVVL